MKQLFILLLLVYQLYSVTFYSETQLNNMSSTTTNLSIGDCIVLSGSNFSNVVFCVTNLVNQNIQLNYSGQYINPSLNLTVTGPSYPIISKNLNGGESYTNSSINVVCLATNCTANSCMRNINRPLNFGESFIDSYTNITLTAPVFPKLNLMTELNDSQTITSSDTDYRFNYSISCHAPSQSNTCYQNISTSLRGGETFRSDKCNIFLSCVQGNLGINQQLDYGETYSRPDLGITFKAPAKCNEVPIKKYYIQQNLTFDSPWYDNQEAEIKIGCNFGIQTCPNQTTLVTAGSIFAGNEINGSCNSTIVLNGNKITYCAGKITSLCSDTEKISGDLEGCINRLANLSMQRFEECVGQKAKLQEDYNGCTTGQSMSADNTNNLITLVSLVTILIVIGAVGILFLKKQQVNVD